MTPSITTTHHVWVCVCALLLPLMWWSAAFRVSRSSHIICVLWLYIFAVGDSFVSVVFFFLFCPNSHLCDKNILRAFIKMLEWALSKKKQRKKLGAADSWTSHYLAEGQRWEIHSQNITKSVKSFFVARRLEKFHTTASVFTRWKKIWVADGHGMSRSLHSFTKSHNFQSL